MSIIEESTKITPKTLVDWFFKDFYKLVCAGIVFGSVSIFYVLSLYNIYSSQAILISNVSDSKSMSGALSKLGGLASLAGVNLGGSDSLSPEILSEKIKSNSFLAGFIRAHQLEAEIFAAKGFEPQNGQFIYDESTYDGNQKIWVRKFKYPKTLEPNDLELVEKFKESFTVGYSRKTDLITISFASYSPESAQKILIDLIRYFNAHVKEEDIKNARSSISYLKDELEKTQVSEVRESLQDIMGEHLKRLAFAETRDDYALKFIDRPLIAANKTAPKRSIICVLITLGGTFFFIIVLWGYRAYKML